MNNETLLIELEKLVPENGFKSQKAAIEWTNKISPLLNKLPNKHYYEVFSDNAQYFCLPLSADFQTSAYNTMKSQLNSAIEELKLKVKEEKEMLGKHFPANSYLNIQEYVSNILKRASSMILICDPYIQPSIVEEVSLIRATQIHILTNNPKTHGVFKKRLGAAKSQFPDKLIEVRLNTKFHDRHLILDEKEIWSMGTSYDGSFGKKTTTIQPIKDDAVKLISYYTKMWNESDLL